MTMIDHATSTCRAACIGAVRVDMRGHWFGYWFIDGVPTAMS
ncbi:MAG: hypothetical protein U5L98_17920 [Halomonas sp.]|nr:hypothetical protein [Halomonas sp.]MDZ7854451.1 hypothetical protein [Halomonas sp.]